MSDLSAARSILGRWARLAVLVGIAPSIAAAAPYDVVARLGEADVDARREAERVLSRPGEEMRAPRLEALGHPDYRIRVRALRAILRARDVAALPVLVERLGRDEPAADVRAALAFVVSRLGLAEALPILRAELGHFYWHRRLNAVEDLGALGDAGALLHLAPVLDDGAWLVRLAALRSIRKLAPDAAWAFASVVADEEWVVRREALDALAAAPSSDATAPYVDGAIATALFDEELVVRRRAAALLEVGSGRAAALDEAMRFAIQNEVDEIVRGRLVFALSRSSDEGADERLAEALLDRAWSVRAAAAAALSRRGRPDAAPAVLSELVSQEAAARPAPDVLRESVGRFAEGVVLAALTPGVPRAPSPRLVRIAELLALLGPSAAVRAHAARWLASKNVAEVEAGVRLVARVGAADFADPLLGVLAAAKGSHLRAVVAKALGELAPRLGYGARARVVDALEARLRVEKKAPRAIGSAFEGALVALVAEGPAPESLGRLATSPSAPVRRAAFRWMAQLGLAPLDPTKALRDPDGAARAAAIEAVVASSRDAPGPGLASAGPLPAGAAPPPSGLGAKERAAIAALMKDPQLAVRRAAARALAELGEPAALASHLGALEAALAGAEPIARRMATLELAQLAVGGDERALASLATHEIDADAEIRRAVRAGLRRAPLQRLRALASGPAERTAVLAAALALARRGDGSVALAKVLAPLAAAGAKDAAEVGEIRASRLAARLVERLPEPARTPALRRYVARAVAPELLAEWADTLSRDLATRWRGTPPYNMRRQHLFDREIAQAARKLPGLPPRVLKALLFQESNLEPLAGNQYDCVGLAAFCRRAAAEEGIPMSAQFRDFGSDARYAPAAAIDAAVRHLRRKAKLLEDGPFARFGAPRGRDYWAFVLAAYNGGHGQVAAAMEAAHEAGALLAKARGLRGAAAESFARAHASRWENLLVPDEAPEESALHEMTSERYGWYAPYGRYRKMKGAEAKYHEIGQFPLDILDRAFEDPAAHPEPAALVSPRFAEVRTP